jgi:hypothetical protein
MISDELIAIAGLALLIGGAVLTLLELLGAI